MSWQTGKRIRCVERVNGARIRCYDNGGKTADRYTVAYIDDREDNRTYCCRGMSHNPTHPQGVGMYGSCVLGPHLGNRILFKDLPEECQRVVRYDCGEGVQ